MQKGRGRGYFFLWRPLAPKKAAGWGRELLAEPANLSEQTYDAMASRCFVEPLPTRVGATSKLAATALIPETPWRLSALSPAGFLPPAEVTHIIGLMVLKLFPDFRGPARKHIFDSQSNLQNSFFFHTTTFTRGQEKPPAKFKQKLIVHASDRNAGSAGKRPLASKRLRPPRPPTLLVKAGRSPKHLTQFPWAPYKNLHNTYQNELKVPEVFCEDD